MSSNCVSFNQDASVSTKHVIEYLKKMVPNKKDLINIMLILLQESEVNQQKELQIQSNSQPELQPQIISNFDNFIQKPLCIKLDNDILQQENIIQANSYNLENIIHQDTLLEPIELFVRNLAFCTTNETLYSVFSHYGQVVDAHVQYEPNYNSAFMKSKGFGFVTFQTAQSAQFALLDKNIIIDNRPVDCHLSVNGRFARPPNKHNKKF